jgi:hypothetical protein
VRVLAKMTDFIQLPPAKMAQIRTTFEAGAAGDRQTSRIANVITALAHACEATTGHQPMFEFKVTRNDAAVLLEVSGVPALNYSGTCATMALYPRDVASLSFVFNNEQTMERVDTGCVRVQFWHDNNDNEEDAAASQTSKRGTRVTYTEVPRSKRLKRCVEFDFTDLNVDADDRATLESLIECLIGMSRLMPEIHISIEPLMKTSNGLTAKAIDATLATTLAPKKRYRAATNGTRAHAAHVNVDDDLTVANDGDTRVVAPNDPNHVGFCLFAANVPNVDFAFLEYLKNKFGTRILDIVVIAPTKWVEASASNGAVAASAALSTPAELAISVRRSVSTEAESGEYALLGSNRVQRVIARNAKAFGGVPCAVNGNH